MQLAFAKNVEGKQKVVSFHQKQQKSILFAWLHKKWQKTLNTVPCKQSRKRRFSHLVKMNHISTSTKEPESMEKLNGCEQKSFMFHLKRVNNKKIDTGNKLTYISMCYEPIYATNIFMFNEKKKRKKNTELLLLCQVLFVWNSIVSSQCELFEEKKEVKIENENALKNKEQIKYKSRFVFFFFFERNIIIIALSLKYNVPHTPEFMCCLYFLYLRNFMWDKTMKYFFFMASEWNKRRPVKKNLNFRFILKLDRLLGIRTTSLKKNFELGADRNLTVNFKVLLMIKSGSSWRFAM